MPRSRFLERGGRARVERRLDGSVWVRFRGRHLSVTRCAVRPPTPSVGKPRRPASASRKSLRARRWMKDFDLQQSRPLWKILRQEGMTLLPTGHPTGTFYLFCLDMPEIHALRSVGNFMANLEGKSEFNLGVQVYTPKGRKRMFGRAFQIIYWLGGATP